MEKEKKKNRLVHHHRWFVKHWFEHLLKDMKESDHWELACVDTLSQATNISPHIFFFSINDLVMLEKHSTFSVYGFWHIDKFLTFLEKSLKYGLGTNFIK